MPVRKIPKSYTVVTGLVATDKSETMTAYEGDLERDFMKLLTFDVNVLRYEEQPVKIYFVDADGKERSYTPDILIFYHDGSTPLLVEIKPRRFIKKNWKQLKPKFRAAIRYAKERGWRFKIISEVEIRTPYLKNVVFLLGFRNLALNQEDLTLLSNSLHKLSEATPETLLLTITQNKTTVAQLIPSMWYLVANFRIGIDLEKPITMKSRIWLLQ